MPNCKTESIIVFCFFDTIFKTSVLQKNDKNYFLTYMVMWQLSAEVFPVKCFINQKALFA